MHETPADVEQLQQVLNQSMVRAGAFLRASFAMPSHTPSARQLVRYLDGLQTVAFATSTRNGAPRVAPTSALFYRGAFYIPTMATAARARHVKHRPAVSLTLYERNLFALILHGAAHVLTPGDSIFASLDELHRGLTGISVSAWGEGVYLGVVAEALYSYVRDPPQDDE